MRLTSDARRPERAAIKLLRKVVFFVMRNLAAHQCRYLDATAEPVLQVFPIEIYIEEKEKSSEEKSKSAVLYSYRWRCFSYRQNIQLLMQRE